MHALLSMASLILFLCTGNILVGFKFSVRSFICEATGKKGRTEKEKNPKILIPCRARDFILHFICIFLALLEKDVPVVRKKYSWKSASSPGFCL